MLEFFQMVLHIDQTLGVWVEQYGSWVYLVLFLIIFAETGLVVLPFLPGDSLLFIAVMPNVHAMPCGITCPARMIV